MVKILSHCSLLWLIPFVPLLSLAVFTASIVVPLFRTPESSGLESATSARPVAVLVDRALGGEERAIESLYRRTTPMLFGRVMRLLRNRSDAEDVVQEAFLQAIRELGSLREPERFGAWLTTIAVRMCHRRFRRQRFLLQIGFAHNMGEQGLQDLAAPGVDPETRLLLAAVDEALLQLPARWRLAWMLRHVEGCALQEVAEQCECSLATTKRYIDRAQQAVGSELFGPSSDEKHWGTHDA